jgi:hypothetical protein
MAWSFVLANQAGVTIDVLDGSAKQVQLEYQRSDVGKAIVQLDTDDERAIALISQVVSITPRIYCYRDGSLEFAGFLTSIEQTADSEGQLTATFEDGLALLRYRLTEQGTGAGSGPEYYSQNSSSIIASSSLLGSYRSLLSQANNSTATGLIAGSVVTTGSVDIEELVIGREIILDRILEISRMTGGPDLRTNPQAQGSTLATLDVGPLYTATTPAAVFGYGAGTVVNVLSVAQQITPPKTRVTVVGADVEASSTVTSTITTAESGLGRWESVESRSDIQSTTDCTNTADALVRASWTQTINFTPDPAIAPVPLSDYNVGDPIRITVNRGSLAADATARVNKIAITIDSSGVETDHSVECEIGNAVVTSPAAAAAGKSIVTARTGDLTSSSESIQGVVRLRR